MIQKKVCMLGSFSVGKTSLVRRFVESMFSDAYLTTVGVKIDKKPLQVEGNDLTLMLWDIYGEDDFQKMRMSYLRGARGSCWWWTERGAPASTRFYPSRRRRTRLSGPSTRSWP
jgi:GTPase SAR1 family protein